jgi:hypothetical protein
MKSAIGTLVKTHPKRVSISSKEHEIKDVSEAGLA